MPKGRKRTQAEYEKEIEEAARRMQKHPEYRNSARNNKTWQNFLVNVLGINIDSEEGQKFFNDVRSKIVGTREPAKISEYQKYITRDRFSRPTMRQLTEARATLTMDSKGKTIHYKSSGLPKYRSSETGRFVSMKSIKELL